MRKLINAIHRQTDMRLVVPFGLHLEPGDVVAIDGEGRLSLEGDVRSLLATKRPAVRAADPADSRDLLHTSGKSTSFTFRAEGEASTLFPELPSASARFDIAFGAESAWLLAMTGRRITALTDANSLRSLILDAYRNRVWRPEYVVVTSVATAQRMTFLASRERRTKVILELSGKVDAGGGAELALTARPSIRKQSAALLQCLSVKRSVVACSGLRVKDRWWSPPHVGTLANAETTRALSAPDGQFWEKMDSGL